jgi:DHA1 family bicyclomycin/chloramphenicol resistance-like MFS transporter
MTSSTATPALSATRTALIGGMLTALASVSMALYTPAMPTLTAAFGTTMAMVKTSLTAFFAGFALSQLVCGPVSDAFGRRFAALLFLTLYTLGGIGALFAETIETLIAARALQGVGAAIGVGVSRAVVRDLFTGEEAARILATIGIVLSIGPAISPTLGGFLLALFGWRAVFVVMALFGVTALVVVFTALPETNHDRDPAKARPDRVIATYAMLARDRHFLLPVLSIGFSVGAIFTLGTLLPFVLIERVGLAPAMFGVGMLAQTLSYLSGGVVARALIPRVGAERLILPGLILGLLGASGTLLLGRVFSPSYLAVMIPVGAFAFSISLVIPGLTNRAMAPHPRAAGSASSLLGFVQMGAGFLGGVAATAFADPVVGLGVVFPVMLAVALGARLVDRGLAFDAEPQAHREA